jgi:DNA-directed RNA polymerase specialized sigma24 family protein
MPDYRGHTSLGGSERQFPLTEWTKLADQGQREAVLAELCERYWKPLYAYLRGRGFSNEDAKDLVQGFFTERVLGQEFIHLADRTKGRFRNFLLVALRNYVINVEKKRASHRTLGPPQEEPSTPDAAEAQFNRAWADALLERTLRELETECRRKGRDGHWHLFREWLLESPAGDGKKEMADVCARYGFSDPTQGYKVICKLKGRFREILRRHLRTLADTEMEVDLEISEFIESFSR